MSFDTRLLNVGVPDEPLGAAYTVLAASVPAPVAAVVCVVPSGNLKPPVVDSITPLAWIGCLTNKLVPLSCILYADLATPKPPTYH